MDGKRRSGFTLVELLVVVAIIGVLVALLLPAIQSAREAARRSQCSNNFKQMAIALQNYHDTYNKFPPGHIIPHNRSGADGHNVIGTWPVLILPYIEQQSLYDRYDHNVFTHQNGANNVNVEIRETSIPTYLCPSDTSRPGELGNPGQGGRRFDGTMFARSSYVGVSGKTYGHPNVCPDRCGNWDFTWSEAQQLFNNGYAGWRGILSVIHNTSGSQLTTAMNMANVLDGTSNTLILGEAHKPVDRTDRGPFWALGANTYTIRAVMPNSWNIQYLEYARCEAGWPNNHCQRSWGAYHPGGLNWALADGTVRFVSANVDMLLLAELASAAGKEATQMP